MTIYSRCSSFLIHEREEGRCESFHYCPIPPPLSPKQGLFQVAWEQNVLISKPAECDLWFEFLERYQKKQNKKQNTRGQWDSCKRDRRRMSTIPSEFGWKFNLTQQCSPGGLRKHWPTAVHRGVPPKKTQKQREEWKKWIFSLLQLLLREPGLPSCAVIG